jgi:GT2 family glycosyltransferase
LDPVIYIPTVNGGELLIEALASLDAGKLARTVVVDNGSAPERLAAVRDRFPDIEVHRLARNAGFGPAINSAVREFGGDPLILLNDDVSCEPKFLEELLKPITTAEMVAGVLLQKDRPHLIDSAGVIVEDDTLLAFDYLHGHSVEALVDADPPLGPSGGAACFRRSVFDEVGGFDERIFAYYEDVDLAMRMRVAGARCELAPAARVHHAFSATLGSHSGRKYARTGWSRGYLLRRYGVLSRPGPAVRAVTCEGVICTGQMLRAGTAAGVRGRISGWRAGRGLPVRPRPAEDMIALSLADRLRLRAQRRR